MDSGIYKKNNNNINHCTSSTTTISGADFVLIKNDTIKLLKNAQKLLKSIDDTLKRSNSICINKTTKYNNIDSRLTLLSKINDDDNNYTITNNGSFIEKKEIISNCRSNEEKKKWIIPEYIVRTWAAQILLALEALHQQNVIILDLRPDNILIDDYGNVSVTYIVPSRNYINLLRLKKPYSSPESCTFTPAPISISTSSDVWSFGILLYELLTGFVSK